MSPSALSARPGFFARIVRTALALCLTCGTAFAQAPSAKPSAKPAASASAQVGSPGTELEFAL